MGDGHWIVLVRKLFLSVLCDIGDYIRENSEASRHVVSRYLVGHQPEVWSERKRVSTDAWPGQL